MTNRYTLTCIECAYGRTSEGVERALDHAEAHRTETGPRHFVDIEILERDGRPED
ncbi:hypothetical protein [Halomarina oriensis]|uniref:Uncharacterized protein n=1 Tax=Halomarina oriensis TaxID=671145 RepID=A0A6B0GUY3_9EURY|nr:hypothetical protein [Halomarina oriensis]MWG36383.1 hypothetical protein [Halomarina oriensis]